ncbi:MAG TPA: phospholipid carrier-dependent glycosyltransferase, partial [Pyrinomonadaceae bacterium]|nr:phospholipid carrier-dependent glycosyltransferase [Pyrinomonadaceae bacterium]
MTKPEPVISSSRSAFVWLCAIVIVAFYFFGLTIPLVGPDEPRYAQVAREMYERADWITPTLGGFNWFEKPALLYWLEIVSYRLFGVNEFAARFGSALFGLGTVLCLWIIGRVATSDGRSSTISFANWLA